MPENFISENKYEEDLHKFDEFDKKQFEKVFEKKEKHEEKECEKKEKHEKKDFEKKECEKKEKHEEKICIKVPKVVGRNDTQILVEAVIPFPPEYPAVAIKDIQKEVKDLKIFVCNDKVLINGVLHKNINFKTFEDELEKVCKCEFIDVYFGNVMHVGADIPFAGFIEVPGAKKGDGFQVEFAGVEDCCEVDILEDPVCVKEDKSITAFKRLREKVIIKIDLKVLREVQITVKPEECNICP